MGDEPFKVPSSKFQVRNFESKVDPTRNPEPRTRNPELGRRHWIACWRRDRQAADAILIDRPGDEPRCLDVLDEFAQIFRAGETASGDPDRLLDPVNRP